MRPTKSMATIDIGKEAEMSDEEITYLQTQKTLKEALAEQKILRERLKTLETRNQPAKWGKPEMVQSFEATRGQVDSSKLPPEKIAGELKNAQRILESAKRATEKARAELSDLLEEIEVYKQTATNESQRVIDLNAKHHKEEAQNEQKKFSNLKTTWTEEKSGLLSEAERLSLISHDALHKASQMREQVEGQRKKIQSLAAEFRADLSKSKELREMLDEYKTKISLTDNLTAEMDLNKRKSDLMLTQINEQKMLMRAVRVSQAAKQKIEDLTSQTEELTAIKNDAEKEFDYEKRKHQALVKKEAPLNQQLLDAEDEFKKRQMEVLVLEADIRELNAELKRTKPRAISEGRRNVNLQHALKKKNMDATQNYLVKHQADVFAIEKVAASFQSISTNLDMTVSTPLPPLSPNA